jgi:hypothetical protein
MRIPTVTDHLNDDLQGIYSFTPDDAGKPKRPKEIPSPGKEPETTPSEEPEPNIWPQKTPEINPGKEPRTTPPTAPPEVPPPPSFRQLVNP